MEPNTNGNASEQQAAQEPTTPAGKEIMVVARNEGLGRIGKAIAQVAGAAIGAALTGIVIGVAMQKTTAKKAAAPAVEA